jgi:hypothetical protein
MSNKIQQMREAISKGDPITVVEVSQGRDIRKRARVIDVVRAAATVQVEGEQHPRRVRFQSLELVTQPEKSLHRPAPDRHPPPIVERLRVSAPDPAPPRIDPQPPQLAPVPPASPTETPLDAWLAMGEELQTEMQRELDTLVETRKALEDEKAEIDREIEATVSRAEKIRTQISRMKSVREVPR